MNRKELELTVLGTILSDFWVGNAAFEQQAFDWAMANLTEEDFRISEHKKVFQLIKTLHEQGKSRAEIIREVEKKFESLCAYMVEFAVVTLERFLVYARELIQDTVERQKAEIGQLLAQGEITEKEAIERLNEVGKRLEDKDKKPIDAFVEFFSEVTEGENKRLYSGFPQLDGYVAFRPGEVSIIGARPSVGKTATAVVMAYNQLLNGHKVLFFSMELPAKEIMLRVLSYVTDWNLREIKNGKVPLEVLTEKADELSNLPIIIYDNPNLTVPLIRAKIQQHKPDIVYIDYVQRIVEHKKFEKRLAFLNYVSIELTNIAKEFKVPVVALAQLNRGTRAGKDVPTMENLKDTGHLEQDATNIILLHRDFKESPHVMQFLIAKCREGAPRESISYPFVNGFPQPDPNKLRPEPVPYGTTEDEGGEEVADELFNF